jgi:type II secretory pathway component GspD/PulD (secretin)
VSARLARALLAGLASAVAACVSEEVRPYDSQWQVTSDQPTVAGQIEPPLISPFPPSGPQTPGVSAPPSGPQAAAPGAPQDATATTQDQAEQERLLKLLKPATEQELEPDFLSEAPPSPFHRLGHNVVRGMDGSWSKLYPLKSERGESVVKILQSNVPGFPAMENTPNPPEGKPTEIVKWVLHKDFYKDNTFLNAAATLGVLQPLPNPNVADMLIVTAPPETLLFIDQLLDKVLADLPQIELQVRVVEVNLDDLLDWDTKIGIGKFEHQGQPFDPEDNPIDGNFGAGFPILDNNEPTGFGAGFGSFLPPKDLLGFLVSLQGVHNGVQVDALLSLLQTIGASELISAPTVTVLNGHRAMINTGSKVPVFTATGIGTNAQISTTFEETGVRVELIPFIVNEDVIRIDLSVDVSAVTGVVPLILAGTEVATPIISTRSTGTTVHVYSGQVFAVGGLRNRESIETISKVPVLGDIPILGWAFKSRSSRVKNSEILFFITPTIRIPSETLVAPIGP